MVARRISGRRLPVAPTLLSVATVAGLAMPTAAAAYVGPGAGLTAIGIVVALLAAVVLALVGFVWYPLRRLMNRRGGTETETTGAGETE